MIVLDLSKERPDTGGVGAGDECRKVSTRALPGSHRIREKVLKQRSTLTVLVAGSGAAMIMGGGGGSPQTFTDLETIRGLDN